LTTPKYDTDDTDWENYGSADGRLRGAFGLFLGLDFGPLIGEIGTVLSFDRAKVYYSGYYDGYYDGRSARAVALHVPLLVKMDFHLGPVVLQPLLGPYFNFALGDLRIDSARDPYANPLFGLVFGGLAGLNLGRGILFIDGRYEMDLGRTVAGNDPITIWSRSAFILSLGYQIYLGRRR
jgi:hypothetical protein